MKMYNGVASLVLATMTTSVLSTTAVFARSAQATDYDLPAQSLETALREVGRIAGRQILISTDAVGARMAPALRGRFSTEAAVTKLLSETGLEAVVTNDAILVSSAGSMPPAGEDPNTITVTGTRIRGAASASPVTTLTTDDAVKQGRHSVAELITTLPQNYGGGQNPGVGAGIPNAINITGASSLNLRGIGPDATLTILDGHRIAYGGTTQSIDVSMIPFLAIDRLEVVPDGASAVYGSDAVAGVANIILKERFSGVQTAINIDAPTSGGGLSQQYGILAGTDWGSGHVYASYEYGHNDSIIARDRSFATASPRDLMLYPQMHHHDIVAKVSQNIGPNLKLGLEGFYNDRSSLTIYPLDLRSNYLLFGFDVASIDKSFSILPTLDWSVGSSWKIRASGSYAQDHAAYTQVTHLPEIDTFSTCTCNSSSSADLNAEGPLFSLPGGPIRLAVGAGYRRNTLKKTDQFLAVSQNNYFGYAEVETPIVSEGQEISAMRRLIFNAAGRVEHYPGVATVGSPKLGVTYTPIEGIDIKGSWGKSFRAPTLFQQYDTSITGVYLASQMGLANASPTALALYTTGGNQNLKPERATTFSATLDLKPLVLPGTHLSVSYFNINYRNRIVAPIDFQRLAFSNPAYAEFAYVPPSAEQLATAEDAEAFSNFSGQPYDRASVAGIANNINVNAENQKLHGVDFAGGYDFKLANDARIHLIANGSYIDSRQKISVGEPDVTLAGTLYHPPHFQGRAGVLYEQGHIGLNAFFNYTGGVRDTRTTPTWITGTKTVDLAFNVKPGQLASNHDLTITLALRNLTNNLPRMIRQAVVYDIPFDATNYSPFGRTIGLSISNRW